ncbi:MAG TPA: hypothetical protein VGT08_00125 [Terracidiphilus sp.]|nr:hypothetical protein [Nitrospira sp.]HEV2483919.1 hypothetical protein [Terracidiphilus sp.]
MEISPITGIRAMPVMKAPPAGPELSALFDIENSAGPGDDSYSGSGKKATGGQDDESEEMEESVEAEPGGQAVQCDQGAQIDYFA